jgi:IstB-like ATP binding protein
MKAEREGMSVMTVNAEMLDEEPVDGKEGGLSAATLIAVAKPKLLIIENLGAKKLASAQAKALAQVLTERVNKASTVITCVHTLATWVPRVRASLEVKSLLGFLSVHAGQIVIGTKIQSGKRKEPAPAVSTVQAQG